MNYTSSFKSASTVRLLTMANQICEKYGLPMVTQWELEPMYDNGLIEMEEMVPAIVRRNDTVTLWIDRWYMAVQVGNGDIEYLYLTRFHIAEERESYAELAECRDDPACLPQDIASQFDRAEADMDAEGKDTWYSNTYRNILSMTGVA